MCLRPLVRKTRCKVRCLAARAIEDWKRGVICFVLTSWDVDFLVNMSASADVLAQAKVEVELAAIPEGKNVSIGVHYGIAAILIEHRSSSNGAASQSSSDTGRTMRSRRQRAPNGNL